MAVATLYELGAKLRKARSDKGLKQKDVAQVLDVAHSMVSQYETGANTPTLEAAATLAGLYGLSLDELTGLSSRPVVSAEGLSAEQVTTIQHLIESFRAANK